MPLRYDIAPHPDGWAVLEDGVAVETRPERGHAAEVAKLLDLLSRAVNGPSAPAGGSQQPS
jgi:hypothetical protein